MGQGQSSNNESAEEPPLKADYYELLGVERTATDEEIKRSYRRKALELHPDRNYGNVENATKLFAEIQSAYEVLSDPQERAWYDSHRDLLLRGEQATGGGGDEYSYNIRLTTAEEVLKLMLKFNGKVEYSDTPSGFYGGLREFFGKLAKEEDIACQWESQEPLDYPDFGSKDDDYEGVIRPFYAAWVGFATRKTYSWKDGYRLSDAPDRRIRRLMEKENKKLRDEAAQEYNDAVRSLVAFVRKRDPRVQNNQKSEADRQRVLREATAAQAARSRAARQARLDELDNAAIPDWAQSKNTDQHEGGFSSESEVEEHEYECVVCDKVFKSEAQFHAHEKNKKHVRMLKQLKKEMRDEGADLDLGTNPKVDNSESPEESPETTSQTHGGRESQSLQTQADESGEESMNTAAKTSTDAKIEQRPESTEESDVSNDDYAPRTAVENRLDGSGMGSVTSVLDNVTLDGTPLTSESESVQQQQQQPKLGRAKQKRAKKAAHQASGDANGMDSSLRCAVCQAEFPSKTKLFNHIKDKGHAAPLAQTKGIGGGRGSKGKKR